MAEISPKMVMELRQRTGVGMMECKKALAEANGDIDLAIESLRKRGAAKAASKADRVASEGVVESYIHPGGRVGVLVEVNCETDFVARTEDFQQLAKNIAMHIAAMGPIAVRREELPETLVASERAIYADQVRAEGKPEAIVEKIVDGKLKKWFSEVALLDQPYVRDDKKTVGDLLQEAVAKMGENIQIRRFSKFRLGQD
ncbi:MAG: translation elongation factor Ts [Candidatus Eiseniibacteriota bacterium]